MVKFARTNRLLRNRSAEFFIQVFSDDNASLQGKIEHIHTGQFQEFRSIMEMIVLIQQKLDEFDFPQSATEIRSWATSLPHPHFFERGK